MPEGTSPSGIFLRESNLLLTAKKLPGRSTPRQLSISKKSGWSWAFSDRYGRMDKGDERCWNVGKWIEIW
jgi:hypothetical protein